MAATPVLTHRLLSYETAHHTPEALQEMYRNLLLPRMIEEKMLLLLRQGKISKWFSGIGQEAISVGVTMALQPQDYLYPLHRNLGLFTARNMPLKKLFCQWQGKQVGYTKGRDRSFHFGSPEDRVIGMISHLGAMLGVADGTSLAARLSGTDGISAVFSGDGGASEGDFHEAINVAAVWDLPVIFVIENNGYGLSTPSNQQFRCESFVDKAIGYGIEGYQVDGNNIVEVFDTVRTLAAQMRETPKPVILEAMTFRMRGHEEASGTKYVPQELMDEWAQRDPLVNFELYLLEKGVLTEESVTALKAEIRDQIAEAWAQTEAEPDITPNAAEELADVYAPAYIPAAPAPEPGTRELRLVDAIKEGLDQAMEANPGLILMGQDIAEYGGVFKITEGFVDKYGKGRVRNTPLCESAILGCGLGLTLQGYSAMVEMQFADFVSCGFNQIINNLAKTHYRWAHPVNVTVRMPTGAGVAAGPFHSQSDEAWFFHTPGLKVVYPSNPFDAKGLLATSLREPNPVLYFEHKALYRRISGAVPEAYYELPLGVAAVPKTGTDITVVTYGAGVHWAMEAQAALPDISLEIIDLRTLLPWDRETVFASVQKTGKVLVLHEDCHTGGIGGEIAATLGEEMFRYLDAPVSRLASLDTPVPFNAKLEEEFLPTGRLVAKLQALAAY